ncbi:MAG: adenylate/guanylate cyclase domain-containing protein [Saprospiraceae bacterium]
MKFYSVSIVIFLLISSNGPLAAQSVGELKARLNRAQTKPERLQLSYDLAQALMSGRKYAEAASNAYTAHEIAIQLGEKRMASDAALLSGEAQYRAKRYPDAITRFIEAWNTARNYGHRDVALQAAERLLSINKEQRNLAEALKWSQEMISYLQDNSGRSSGSGDVARRLEKQISALEAENRDLREQLAQATGQTAVLETTFKEQIQQVEAFSQEEVSKRDATITQISTEKDSVERVKRRELEKMNKQQMLDSIIKVQLERDVQAQKAISAEIDAARQKSESARNFLVMVSALILVIAALFFLLFRSKQRTANDLSHKNKIIEDEQKRSDELLLNILPLAIAQELKTKKKVAARKYDDATVMFIDFTGFTQLSELLSPEQLVAELDYCFSSFDRIISQYRIEKIKTVGDAYICASGLSDKNASPTDMVKAALQIQDFLLHLKAERMNQGMPCFEARIGIHTGPVVAGVVGEKKFAYDIWGDTVNTAARMEETCSPGRVNVSEDTYWKAKYEFEWQPRGKVAAKNKGMMDMYYVTGMLGSKW